MTKNKKNKNKSKAALAVVEKRRREKLIKESYLAFPVQSRYYEIGTRLLRADPINNARHAVDAYLRGSNIDGCIRCMIQYYQLHTDIHGMNMIQLRLPWLLEAAIRGCYTAIATQSKVYIGNSQRQATFALDCYWGKRARILHPQLPTNTKEVATSIKEFDGNRCAVCNIACCDGPRTLVQCSGCSYYSYCSKEHQIEHWNTWNHRGECKQLKLLNTYHKPYAKQIHHAILRGDKPATIRELQLLRTKLGLNRPTEDYDDLVASLLQDDNQDSDNKDENENGDGDGDGDGGNNNDNDNDNDNENENDNTNSNTNNSSNHPPGFVIPSSSLSPPPPDNNTMNCFVARNDGTVHIGSAPEIIER